MKKVLLLFVILLNIPGTLPAEVYPLKLRSSFFNNYLRIVLEGPESALSKAIVNQKDDSVVVTIPDTVFTIEQDKATVRYRKMTIDSVVFYPGTYRGLKVFRLQYPNRLVMDVYITDMSAGFSNEYTESRNNLPEQLISKKTIVIDPGHGGYDSGIREDNYSEKNVVLDIAQKLGVLLHSNTTETFLTRKIDQYMSQTERVTLANRKEPDIFLTLHIGNHSGVTLYYPVIADNVPGMVRQHLSNSGQAGHLKDSLDLLRAMEEAFKTEFGNDMVVVRPLPYSMLSNVQAAAVMVELPSFEDAKYIKDFRVETAKSLSRGFYIYDEIKERE